MSSSRKARGKQKVQNTSPASEHDSPPAPFPHMLPTSPPGSYAPGFFTPPGSFPPGLPHPASPGFVVRLHGCPSSSMPSASASSSDHSGSDEPPSDPYSSMGGSVTQTVPPYHPSSPYYIGEPGAKDEGMLIIYPEVNRGFTPNTDATPLVTLCIKLRWNQAWPTWGKVPYMVKLNMFEDFTTKCKWHPALDNIMRSCFIGKCSDLVKNSMYTCRDKGTKPDWIYPDKWELLLQYWQTPEFQRKSEQAKKNWASEEGGSLHTGGSFIAATQRMRMEKKEGRQIPVPRLFKSRHILKNKKGEEVWVEPRAKAAFKKAQAAFDARNARQASECGSSTPAPMTVEEETALWLDVNGGPKKGYAYGLGSMYASDRLNLGLFGFYSTPASSVNPSTEAKFLEQIEELRRQREEDRVRNEENMARNEANMAAMREIMQN